MTTESMPPDPHPLTEDFVLRVRVGGVDSSDTVQGVLFAAAQGIRDLMDAQGEHVDISVSYIGGSEAF